MPIDIPSAAFTRLSRAVADNDVAAVRRGLMKASPNDHSGNADGDSLLMVAIRRGTPIDVLRVLVEDGRADVDFRGRGGATARSVAKTAKRADVIAMLDGKEAAATKLASGKPTKRAATTKVVVGAKGAKDAARTDASGFVVWTSEIEPGACSLDGLEGVEEDFKLLSGEAYGTSWPKGAQFPVKHEGDLGGPRGPNKSKSPVVTDAMPNIDSVLVLSERLGKVVGRIAGDDVEILPVKLVAENGKPRPERYVIVHPLGEVDAIDKAASKLSLGRAGKIMAIRKLRLDASRIPRGRVLFRIAGKGDCFIASRALADAVLAAQLTGVRFVEVDAYKGT